MDGQRLHDPCWNCWSGVEVVTPEQHPARELAASNRCQPTIIGLPHSASIHLLGLVHGGGRSLDVWGACAAVSPFFTTSRSRIRDLTGRSQGSLMQRIDNGAVPTLQLLLYVCGNGRLTTLADETSGSSHFTGFGCWSTPGLQGRHCFPSSSPVRSSGKLHHEVRGHSHNHRRKISQDRDTDASAWGPQGIGEFRSIAHTLQWARHSRFPS